MMFEVLFNAGGVDFSFVIENLPELIANAMNLAKSLIAMIAG